MKVNLLYTNRIYRVKDIKDYQLDLIKDLELDNIIKYASNNDPYIKKIFIDVLLEMVEDEETIIYRQDILKDFLSNKEYLIKLYSYVEEVCRIINNDFLCGIIDRSPSSILSTSIELLNVLLKKALDLVELSKGNFK